MHSKSNYPAKKSISDLDVELEDNMEDAQYIKILKFYLDQLNQENFDYVFYIAGVDIHFNDRLGKLKISDEGIRKRDEIVTENFFSKGVPLLGRFFGVLNRLFFKHRSKMGSKKPFGSILDGFWQVFGGFWKGFG